MRLPEVLLPIHHLRSKCSLAYWYADTSTKSTWTTLSANMSSVTLFFAPIPIPSSSPCPKNGGMGLDVGQSTRLQSSHVSWMEFAFHDMRLCDLHDHVLNNFNYFYSTCTLWLTGLYGLGVSWMWGRAMPLASWAMTTFPWSRAGPNWFFRVVFALAIVGLAMTLCPPRAFPSSSFEFEELALNIFLHHPFIIKLAIAILKSPKKKA